MEDIISMKKNLKTEETYITSNKNINIKEKIYGISRSKQNKLIRVEKNTALDLLQELWFQYAQKLLNKVIEVCELDPEQADALRRRELRPNDFRILVGYQ